MAFSQTDLTNIDQAIATGELSVEVNGRKVVYRSVDDLLKSRNAIVSALAADAAPAGTTRRGAFRVTFATHRGD